MPNFGAMFGGRLGQKHYAGLLIAYCVLVYLVSHLGPIGGILRWVVLFVYCGVLSRRLQDIGMNGMWAHGVWIPAFLGITSLVTPLGLIFFFVTSTNVMNLLSPQTLLTLMIPALQIILAFIPGSSGGNRFGSPQPSWQSWRTSILGS